MNTSPQIGHYFPIVSPEEKQLQQRRNALARANNIRIANARLRREMRCGTVSLRQAFESESAQSTQILRLVLTVPGIGDRKAALIFTRLGISPHKRVRDVTPRQRAAILGWLEDRYRRRNRITVGS